MQQCSAFVHMAPRCHFFKFPHTPFMQLKNCSKLVSSRIVTTVLSSTNRHPSLVGHSTVSGGKITVVYKSHDISG